MIRERAVTSAAETMQFLLLLNMSDPMWCWDDVLPHEVIQSNLEEILGINWTEYEMRDSLQSYPYTQVIGRGPSDYANTNKDGVIVKNKAFLWSNSG